MPLGAKRHTGGPIALLFRSGISHRIIRLR
jgi:hypothetical protein